jgi:hypothetical protein
MSEVIDLITPPACPGPVCTLDFNNNKEDRSQYISKETEILLEARETSPGCFDAKDVTHDNELSWLFDLFNIPVSEDSTSNVNTEDLHQGMRHNKISDHLTEDVIDHVLNLEDIDFSKDFIFDKDSEKIPDLSPRTVENTCLREREQIQHSANSSTYLTSENSEQKVNRKSNRRRIEPTQLHWSFPNGQSYKLPPLYDLDAAIKESLKTEDKSTNQTCAQYSIKIKIPIISCAASEDDNILLSHVTLVSKFINYCDTNNISQRKFSSQLKIGEVELSQWKNSKLKSKRSLEIDSLISGYIDSEAGDLRCSPSTYAGDHMLKDGDFRTDPRIRKKIKVNASEQPDSYDDDPIDINDRCSVCWSSITSYQHGSMNCCGQRIHHKCIQEWLCRQKADPNCPLCRHSLNSISAKRVFSIKD